jgi:hypothetical protein
MRPIDARPQRDVIPTCSAELVQRRDEHRAEPDYVVPFGDKGERSLGISLKQRMPGACNVLAN